MIEITGDLIQSEGRYYVIKDETLKEGDLIYDLSLELVGNWHEPHMRYQGKNVESLSPIKVVATDEEIPIELKVENKLYEIVSFKLKEKVTD